MNFFSAVMARKAEWIAALALAFLIILSVIGREHGAPQGSDAVSVGAVAAPKVVPRIPAPVLGAEAYLVRFVDDAEPLFMRQADARMAPASLTKIMTAYAARRILVPADTVIFSREARAVEERRSGVAAGEEFVRDDAVRMAVVESANDAALALAEAAGKKTGEGDYENRVAFFVRYMNESARVMGLADTYFENPTGLDAPGHTASARDIARLASEVWVRDPELFAMTREIKADVFSTEGKRHTIENTNDLLGEFPALAGGKTGMTDNAKGALILLYPVPPSRMAVIVILKSDDRFGDGRKAIRWLEEAF